MARIFALRAAVSCAAALLAAAAPAAAQEPGCVGETSAANVAPLSSGPLLRFGITPGVQTGQIGTGPQPPRTPEDPAKHLAALDRLRAPGRDFVLRLHRFFWSDGEEGIRHFEGLAQRYTSRGYPVELQLRYHPTPEQEGDIQAWVAHVREVVRRFGRNPLVVAIQVTNEVNVTFSPDSSDGSYEGAREALVQGVIAAKDEARRIGSRVEIGFNWAYRVDPAQDTSFWNGVRDRGGKPFVDALDWVGLDAYPGTFFPPYDTPGGERDAIVNALESIRCFMAIPGIPETVPIHVEENGYPTSPYRTEEYQVQAMDTMVRAFHDYRGNYNVSDYRWFNLRDGDSTSPNYGVRYGLLRDDYSEKPAFAAYAGLVRELARPGAVGPGTSRPVSTPRRSGRRRVSVRLVCRRGRVVARVKGARVRSVRVRRAARRGRVRVDVRLRDGRRLRVVRRRPACR